VRQQLAHIFLFLIPVLSHAEGPDKGISQESFEFAFLIFDDFRITPEIGVVYPPFISEHLGNPIRSEVSRQGTRDPTLTVYQEILYFDGLEIAIARGVDAKPSDWTWLEFVYITSPKYKLKSGLRVGDSLDLFAERLKSVMRSNPSDPKEVSFYSGGYGEPGGVTHAAHATVVLTLDQNEVVQSVRVEYWAD
jgi:hypothetical protein